jgi:hypothetical protein
MRVDLETERGSKVAHGTKRTRRGERVTRGPQHRRGSGDLAAELVGQRGLANPGFTAHEHQPTLACRGLAQQLSELIQEVFALE